MKTEIVILVTEIVGSALSLCKEVKKAYGVGVNIIAVNCNYDRIFIRSRYVDHAIRIDSEDREEFLHKMQEWYSLRSFKEIPVLYTTDDRLCLWIDENRAWFSVNFRLTIPSSFIVRAFNYKGRAEQVAQEHGLLVPKTCLVSENQHLDGVYSAFSFPVILKPTSVTLLQGIDFRKTQVLNQDQFYAYSRKLLSQGATFLCQEFIPGEEGNSWFYLFYRGQKGDIYAKVGRKVLQCPPNRGIMAVGMIEVNEELTRISKEFLDSIDYVGIGGIEYKKYLDKYYFIEMSTRLEGFFLLGDISGDSLSQISYQDISGVLLPEVISGRPMHRGIYVDIVHYFIAMSLQKKYFKMIIEFFSFCLDKKVKFNVVDGRDLLPFLCNIWYLVKYKLFK